jgi:hypothetical protein
VLRSVEGLTFDTVFVSFFPSERPAASSAAPIQVPLFGLQLPRYLATWLNPLLGLIFLGSVALAVYTLMRHRAPLREDLGRLFGTAAPPKAIERTVPANTPLAPATPGDSELR